VPDGVKEALNAYFPMFAVSLGFLPRGIQSRLLWAGNIQTKPISMNSRLPCGNPPRSWHRHCNTFFVKDEAAGTYGKR
jgi:hypothetical protein